VASVSWNGVAHFPVLGSGLQTVGSPADIGMPSAPGYVPKYESKERFSCITITTCLMCARASSSVAAAVGEVGVTAGASVCRFGGAGVNCSSVEQAANSVATTMNARTRAGRWWRTGPDATAAGLRHQPRTGASSATNPALRERFRRGSGSAPPPLDSRSMAAADANGPGAAQSGREAWREVMPKGFRWPVGSVAAAAFTFDLDAESPILFDHPESAAWLDVMSHQAYGPSTAVPRLLRLLDRAGIRATF